MSPERVDAPASSSGLSGGSSGLSGGGDKPSAHQVEQPAASSNKVAIENMTVEELNKHLFAKAKHERQEKQSDPILKAKLEQQKEAKKALPGSKSKGWVRGFGGDESELQTFLANLAKEKDMTDAIKKVYKDAFEAFKPEIKQLKGEFRIYVDGEKAEMENPQDPEFVALTKRAGMQVVEFRKELKAAKATLGQYESRRRALRKSGSEESNSSISDRCG